MFLPYDAAGHPSWPRLALGLAVVVVSGMAPGCFPTDNGPEPPQQELYFPTALVPSTKGTALYVVNSDFDLQYKAGTVQALDLDHIHELIPPLWTVGEGGKTRESVCASQHLRLQTEAESVLYPGPCGAIDVITPPDGLQAIVRSAVSIGAFAADAQLTVRSDGHGARLLIPVRGDPSLTWIDVDDERADGTTQTFSLECNQAAANGHCADDHKAGVDASENTRNVTMPSEPYSISVGEEGPGGSAVIVSHQTTGTVSLFQNTWDVRPSMTFVLAGLPTGVTGTLPFPKPLLARLYPDDYPYRPGFLLAFRTSAEVDVVRYYDDAAASPSRPFLSRTQRIGISTNAIGFDSRSIAIDTRARALAESACGDAPKAPASDADYRACLASAAGAPVAAYAANRIPPTLLVGQTTTSASTYGTDDSVYFYDSVPLSQGPSRVYVGNVWDGAALRTRVFILCFDARTLYVYDPDARAMEAVVQTGRGPSALAFDPNLAAAPQPTVTNPTKNARYAYLAHFTDSYIGVLDLDMTHSTYLSIVATVATPAAPRESK